ncbi:MAG: hypothetical protein JRG81_06835 [Deltaproteobacteria bacterium]|nr:hypothetical protein [Deltaproteobacteria bacterium]
MKRFNYVLSLFIALAFLSCSIQPILRDDVDVKKKAKIVKKRKGHGPPPHAPAHGYRHKHQQGVELSYDTGLGVYVVIEIPGMYFNDGLYIRWSNAGYWEVGYHFEGPWRIAVGNEVPDELDQKKGKSKQGKGKGKGRYKVKKQK